MKMLVVFEKSPRLRLIGHLDLMRAMQRALRRSDLPIRYSQGFNPHILLTFAAPLSLGMPGKREIMEVPIDGELAPEVFRDRLSAVLPGDLSIVSVRPVEDTHPASMAVMKAALYGFAFDAPVPELEEKLETFLVQPEIMALRRTKTGEKMCDIRPMIYGADFQEHRLLATLAISESATCKAELFLTALCGFAGVDKPHCLISRLQLFGERDGVLIPLEDA